jgi:hypothetical protein
MTARVPPSRFGTSNASTSSERLANPSAAQVDGVMALCRARSQGAVRNPRGVFGFGLIGEPLEATVWSVVQPTARSASYTVHCVGGGNPGWLAESCVLIGPARVGESFVRCSV